MAVGTATAVLLAEAVTDTAELLTVAFTATAVLLAVAVTATHHGNVSVRNTPQICT